MLWSNSCFWFTYVVGQHTCLAGSLTLHTWRTRTWEGKQWLFHAAGLWYIIYSMPNDWFHGRYEQPDIWRAMRCHITVSGRDWGACHVRHDTQISRRKLSDQSCPPSHHCNFPPTVSECHWFDWIFWNGPPWTEFPSPYLTFEIIFLGFLPVSRRFKCNQAVAV